MFDTLVLRRGNQRPATDHLLSWRQPNVQGSEKARVHVREHTQSTTTKAEKNVTKPWIYRGNTFKG